MMITPGTHLGPYEVLSKLGEGGMGDVWKARDTRLDRTVALKVAKADFTERFEREARAVAALNHPNICTLHDVGPNYLVMELVEGTTLAGPLPVAKAVEIAGQILDGLAAAHSKGITHRDLKPDNILITKQGAKLLDFGLARQNASLANASETLTRAVTSPGEIAGTLQYMSPEQLQGGEVDARSDIFAFGCVLYEMLTGRRAFEGSSAASVIAAILEREPAPLVTTPPLDRLIRRCLAKDPDDRFQTARDLKYNLGLAVDSPVGAATTSPSRLSRLPWALAAVTTMVAVALAVWPRPAATTGDAPVIRLPFDTPDSVVSEVADATISPDGTKIVFAGRGEDGRKILWVRALDSVEATPLPDTDDAIEPFWSWDSKSIAFGAQGKLKRLDLGNARATVLTDAARSNNGSWSRSGDIVFSPDYTWPLFKVAATGGVRTQVTEQGSHRYPVFLPDGRRFLYWDETGRTVMVGSLDSKEATPLPLTARAVYAAPGWLLNIRNGMIVAQAFDADRLELSGEPVPIAPANSDRGSAARLSVSNTGVLAIAHQPGYDYQLAWFDRGGAPVRTFGPAGMVGAGGTEHPRISPDGSRVVVRRTPEGRGAGELWLGHLARGTFERLTTTGGVQNPIWAADGRSVYASATRNGRLGIYRIPIGGGTDDLVDTGTTILQSPSDVTRDGRWLFTVKRGDVTRPDIWAVALTGGLPPKDATPQAIVNSEFEDSAPNVSPDGRWLAYNSDVTGINEVYVRRFTDGQVGPAERVTTGHGTMPRWSADGRTLFYVSAPQGYLLAQMMAVTVTPLGDTLQFGAARPLFKARMHPSLPTTTFRDYDVAPDGRFLVGTVVGSGKGTAATMVINWMTLVTKEKAK